MGLEGAMDETGGINGAGGGNERGSRGQWMKHKKGRNTSGE